MLNYKILNNNKDKFIELPINLDFEPMDNSEIIEEFIREEKRKSLNIPQDFEVFRFNPELSIPVLSFNVGDIFLSRFQVYFYYSVNDVFTLNYGANDFNTDGSSNDDRLKKGFSKSFYVLDYFDSISSIKQNKLFSIIIQTIPEKNINKKTIIPDFIIEKDTEGYFIYYLKDKNLLPKNIFMKLTFFNGKTGKITSFFNSVAAGISGGGSFFPMNQSFPTSDQYKEEMLYFKYRLSNNYTYDIIDVNHGTLFNSKLYKQITAVEVKFKD